MNIKTRFLVVSDTHADPISESLPSMPVDVAIYCGDLTEESKLREMEVTLELLRSINAPLKLVIPGNHDFTLDLPVFRKKIVEANLLDEPELGKREYGDFGQARDLFKQAEKDGIMLLDEGTHQFTLQNGAQLKVYATFSLRPRRDTYEIENGVDVVITHGPPRGILDRNTKDKPQSCGHPEAVARSRPRMHCFGHIHEAWGAKLVAWGNTSGEHPSHLTAIDNSRSKTIETLTSLRRTEWDTPETAERRPRYNAERCCRTSHCEGDEHPVRSGENTLFINAAIQSLEEGPQQLPWVVDIDLPRVTREEVRR
ncbi:ser/Thr protein phosphatase family protein [Cercophora newfieldiana]|uniref:Ser/Thr protein phosphatase family protein n=1 Tax=Cercophora newfieldiana TaxID=92897 RepID=A0AA39YEY6_9PEZI|nr:ser/Thr protein phosphatase family protein [Cercophora newfieldiana]